MTLTVAQSFRERLKRREPLLGTFIKTPSPHATEILGDVGFDFVVVDTEHAPFDRGSAELVQLAARASGIAALVRVPDGTPAHILAALDDGADGVLVPHVTSATLAHALVAASRYRGGRRGFSNSPRAGRYGRVPLWTHVAAADARSTVLAMIEDVEALEHIDAIAAVPDLDGIFIGRGDLTVAMQAESPAAPAIRTATERIAAAAVANGKTVCTHAGSLNREELEWLRGIGVTAFVVSSDQGYLRQAAQDVAESFHART